MADKFSKSFIKSKLKAKATAAGFNIAPDSSSLPPGTPTMETLLGIIAETIEEVLKSDESLSATLTGSSVKIGPTGIQKDASYNGCKITIDKTTDPQFFAWLEAFTAILKVPMIPEAGMGGPSSFHAAMKALIGLKPTKVTGKISQGSTKVKVTT